jgi:hypothetical protein
MCAKLLLGMRLDSQLLAYCCRALLLPILAQLSYRSAAAAAAADTSAAAHNAAAATSAASAAHLQQLQVCQHGRVSEGAAQRINHASPMQHVTVHCKNNK